MSPWTIAYFYVISIGAALGKKVEVEKTSESVEGRCHGVSYSTQRL